MEILACSSYVGARGTVGFTPPRAHTSHSSHLQGHIPSQHKAASLSYSFHMIPCDPRFLSFYICPTTLPLLLISPACGVFTKQSKGNTLWSVAQSIGGPRGRGSSSRKGQGRDQLGAWAPQSEYEKIEKEKQDKTKPMGKKKKETEGPDLKSQ